MLAFRIAIARLRALFRRDATTDEIREELQFHVAMRADEYARRRPGCRRGTAGRAAPIRQPRGDPGPRLRRAGRRRDGDDASGRQVRAAPTGRQPVVCDPGRLDAGARASASPPRSSASSTRRCCGRCPTRTRRSSSPSTWKKPARAANRRASRRRWSTSAPGERSRRSSSQAGMGRVSRFRAADRRHRHAAAPDRRRSLRRLSRDLRHQPILGRGIHADDTRDGAPAVALLGHAYLAARVRRRSRTCSAATSASRTTR